MVFFPLDFKNLLLLLKGREPMKPRYADKGEGWDVLRTRLEFKSINFSFDWAKFPQSMNTIFFSELNREIIKSVISCHPIFKCEPGL